MAFGNSVRFVRYEKLKTEFTSIKISDKHWSMSIFIWFFSYIKKEQRRNTQLIDVTENDKSKCVYMSKNFCVFVQYDIQFIVTNEN